MVEFRDNLILEATATRESALMVEYLARLRAHLAGEPSELTAAARAWLERADAIAAFRDPMGRRVRRLKSLADDEGYCSYFGPALVGK
jgi:glutathione S-transferase